MAQARLKTECGEALTQNTNQRVEKVEDDIDRPHSTTDAIDAYDANDATLTDVAMGCGFFKKNTSSLKTKNVDRVGPARVRATGNMPASSTGPLLHNVADSFTYEPRAVTAWKALTEVQRSPQDGFLSTRSPFAYFLVRSTATTRRFLSAAHTHQCLGLSSTARVLSSLCPLSAMVGRPCAGHTCTPKKKHLLTFLPVRIETLHLKLARVLRTA